MRHTLSTLPVPITCSGRAITSLALGLSLALLPSACKRGGDSNAPADVRTAIEPGLMKQGYNVPRAFSGALTPGTVIDATDESVICSSEQLVEPAQVQAGDAGGLELTGRPLKLGSTLLARLKQAGAGVEGVNVDVSSASLAMLDGFGEPRDAGCVAAISERQNAGKQVMVVTESLTVDASFALVGSGDEAAIGQVLGVTMSGGSGSGSGLIVAYKAEEMPLPNACTADGMCQRARRVDGVCRCVSCEISIDRWAASAGNVKRGGGQSVVLDKDAGFDLTCPNMPEGALEVRAQGMMTTGIIDESRGKVVQPWSGCLELRDRGADASIGDACIEQPEAGRKGYINVVLKDGASPSRADTGDVSIEVRNLGTKLGGTEGGSAALQKEFSLQIRSPAHAR